MAEEFGRNGGEREPPLDLLAATPGDIRPFLKWAAIIVGLVVLFGLVSLGEVCTRTCCGSTRSDFGAYS